MIYHCFFGISLVFLFSHEIYFAGGSRFNGNNWAVLIAGSNQWINYRHQADVCHAYHILRKNGIPKERIITFMYDDIAYAEENPYPGKIFNSPELIDVYRDVIIDYKGADVTNQNIYNVLFGNKISMRGIGSGKVLESGPNDHVFFYYSDHGFPGLVELPNYEYITYYELVGTLRLMEAYKKFKNMLLYMEACFSGSMFLTLPKNINVFAVTASNPSQSSYACYCQGVRGLPCLGDHFSVSWMWDTERGGRNLGTIMQQYKIVKKQTTHSEVCYYGNEGLQNLPLNQFLSGRNSRRKHNPGKNHDLGVVLPNHEHDFHYFHKQLQSSEPGSMEEIKIITKINNTLVDMKYVLQRMEIIVDLLSPTSDRFNEIMTANNTIKIEHGQCFHGVLEKLMETCFKAQEKQHVFKHTQKIVNLCDQSHLSEEDILNTITYACGALQHDKVDLNEIENCWMGQNVCHIFCAAKGRYLGMDLRGSCDNPEKKCKCQQNNV